MVEVDAHGYVEAFESRLSTDCALGEIMMYERRRRGHLTGEILLEQR